MYDVPDHACLADFLVMVNVVASDAPRREMHWDAVMAAPCEEESRQLQLCRCGVWPHLVLPPHIGEEPNKAPDSIEIKGFAEEWL